MKSKLIRTGLSAIALIAVTGGSSAWAEELFYVSGSVGNALENFKISVKPWEEATGNTVQLTLPLDLPEVDLPVDPYSLGLWLGDGNSQRGDLTLGFKDSVPIRVSLTTRDIEYTLGRGKGNSQGTADRVCLLGVAPRLREMGVLNNKHIPMRYLRASEGQRRELLRGLMDTDGYIEKKGCAAIACSNKKLADGIMELLRSLGYKPQRTESTPTYTHKGEKLQGAVSYEMAFYPDTPEECTTLPRHIIDVHAVFNLNKHTGNNILH